MKKYQLQMDKKTVYSSMLGLIFLAFSMLANYLSVVYTRKQVSNSVTDILLDNIPVFNISFFFVEGAIIFIIFLVILMLLKPKRAPFVLKSMALFILIRSISVSLTHIAPASDRLVIETNDFFEKMLFNNALFFSGHTGLPFLFALAYKENKKLRNTFLAMTLVGSVSVILGHLHYSIDVFGAIFITYTIFHIAIKLFPEDYKTFTQENV